VTALRLLRALRRRRARPAARLRGGHGTRDGRSPRRWAASRARCCSRSTPSATSEGLRFENGEVKMPRVSRGLRTYRKGGWTALMAKPRVRRPGAALLRRRHGDEMLCAANLSFSMYPASPSGAYRRDLKHASEELKARYPAPARRRHLGRHHVPHRAAGRHRSRPRAHEGRAAGDGSTGSPATRSSSPPASTT
jgi:hypothetical protein